MVVDREVAVVEGTSQVVIVAAVEGSEDVVLVATLEKVALVEAREVGGEVVVEVGVGEVSVEVIEQAAVEAEADCNARKLKKRSWRDSGKRPRRSILSRRLKSSAFLKSSGVGVVL